MKIIKNLRALSTKRLYELLDELENEKPDFDKAIDDGNLMAIQYIYIIDYFKYDIIKELERRSGGKRNAKQ